MIFAQLALTLLSMMVCAFAPGFFLVRQLRWKPIEKLCGAVGLSLILVWMAAWILYLAVPGAGTVGAAAIVAGCAVLLAAAWQDVRRLFGDDRARHTATALGCLVVWTLVMLATIRHISGAGWTGDWLEHFHRTLVYFNHLPKDVEIFGGWHVPSRPPLAHVLAAMLMRLGGERFEVFQLVFSCFNLLVFLPCCLMLPLIARPWKSGVVPLAAIFALNPLVMVNATYPGTKPLAAFFVVLAIAFYLRARRKPDRARMSAAFLAAAGGVVAHYSAVPYALFLGAHYIVAVFPARRDRMRELATVAGIAAAPLVAWFGWCFAGFGVKGTLSAMANTSVAYGQTYQGSYLMKSLANLFNSIVPHVVRDWALVQAWGQPNTLGYVRDNAFVVYQTSLIFTMGSIGGPLAIWFLIRALRNRDRVEKPGRSPADYASSQSRDVEGAPSGVRSLTAAALTGNSVFHRSFAGGTPIHNRPARRFWLALIPFSVAACFALVGERDQYGIAHITMFAMLAMGLALVAGNFTNRRAVSLLIVAGCALDFSLGVFLQARVEHMENTATRMAFPRIMVGTVRMDLAPAGPDALSRTAGNNWFRKHQYSLAEKWLGAISGAQGLAPGQVAARDALREVIRQDDAAWGGWYRRNGGEIEFIGDHFGDSDWTSLLMVIGCAGVLVKLARYGPPVAVVKAAPAGSRRKPRASG